jgi:formylmethanofuran dehydrogenase subunit A
MTQYRNAMHADPKKWICMDIECDGGCGLVPFNYRDKNFVNALQWAIGLELFLLIEDPWRVFLTTDHPNGAPLTCYPLLIRLLMDKTFRKDCLAHIHKAAQAATVLGSIEREYTLEEIAILTRASPAKLLGMEGYGHLGVGAVADVSVYTEQANKEEMFTHAAHFFRGGVEVVRGETILATPAGATHVVKPQWDGGIERDIRKFFDDYMTLNFDHFGIGKEELEATGTRVVEHPLNARVRS